MKALWSFFLVSFFGFFFSFCSVFAKDSTVVGFFPEGEITRVGASFLFSGQEVFVRSLDSRTIKIPQGDFVIKRGFAYLKREPNCFVIQSLSGESEFRFKKDQTKVALVPMTEVRIYLDGSSSLPKAINLKEHLATFQRIFSPRPEGLKHYASLVRPRLRAARDWTGLLYSDFYQRKMASANQEQVKKVEAEKTQASQREFVRKLFEKKALGFNLDKDPSSSE